MPQRPVQQPPAKPPALVLCRTITGLATVRALGQAHVDVHCLLFDERDPLRLSRYGRKVMVPAGATDNRALVEFLIDYAGRLGSRPVVLPNCDAHALLLAEHAAALEPVCRIPANSHAALKNIVSKDGLYRGARDAGIATIPCLVSEDADEIAEWSAVHGGPYLLKPFYEGHAASSLARKNLVLETRDDLLAYARSQGTRALVLQRLLRGGDGFIFDCYGVCARDGRPLVLASHRRWRQYPADFGTTTYGEIPSGLAATDDAFLFDATERLLRALPYHGIFGIEWLLDRDSGRFYLLDFNARPFITLGHLEACGLNLPLLHYLELIGAAPEDLEPRPALKRLLWVDLWRDLNSFQQKRQAGELNFGEWIRSIQRCRKLAYLEWRDPLPGLERNFGLAKHLLAFALHRPQDRH